MKVKIGLGSLLAGVLFLGVISACGSSEPSSSPSQGGQGPTPDAQATIAAVEAARSKGTATPTAIPPQEREVVVDFARRHAVITRDWERLHADFDEWREGLISCDASTLQAKLREFASSIGGITKGARELPRLSVRGLADKLIEAIEREEEAIRHLRDNWQPGDPAIFEEVDIQRADAAALQKEVQDGLRDLQETASPSSRVLLASYSSAVEDLNSNWERSHRNYDSLLRAREADLTLAQAVDRLSLLIAGFRDDVIEEILLLPTSKVTDQVSQVLAEAAQEEDLVLRRLRNTFQKSESASDGSPSTPSEFPGETGESFEGPPQFPPESATPEEEVTFTILDPSLFDAFDAQIVKSNAMRRQAVQELAVISEDASEENQTAVEEFTKQYNLLLRAWNQFHNGYDVWRQSEGGCDRPKAIERLGSFTISFGELATAVRDLPRATLLRPLGELLVEAAEREEQSLRDLRNTWRPFDSEVYVALDRERNTAGKLRRQVVAGVQDLLSQYEISEQEISQ